MGHPRTPDAWERRRADADEVARLEALHPRDAWHEDYGDVLWWYVVDGDIAEPPHVGHEPGTGVVDRYGEDPVPDYVTHWSHLPHVLTPGEIKRRASR